MGRFPESDYSGEFKRLIEMTLAGCPRREVGRADLPGFAVVRCGLSVEGILQYRRDEHRDDGCENQP